MLPTARLRGEATMLYKTIVLELLRDHPDLHLKLQADKTLLPTLERCAGELRSSHEAWKNRLWLARPGSDESQLASEALELALKDLADRLRSGSRPVATEPLSLDEAMVFLRRHTPTA
jgi:hypothetical protein